MDLVKLLGTLDTIGSKQTLSEAEDRPASAKKETTWKDKSGKEHSAQRVQGWQSRKADKEAEKEKGLDEGKKPDFLDMDKDGDKKEPMSKAIKDKKSKVKESSFSDLLKTLDALVEDEQVDEEKVDEDDVEEGNEFSGARDAAIKAGKKEFEVDGKTYPVKEDEVSEAKDRLPSKEKETTWTDKSGKEHSGKQVQGWQSRRADKEAEDETDKTMKESAQIDECGMGMAQGYEQESGMSINTNIDTRTGSKTVSVTANGDAADELMQILKLSGMSSKEAAEHEGEVKIVAMGNDVPLAQQDGGYKMGEMQEEYANEPAPEVQPVDTQLRQGTDLNKEKTMVKHNYRGGDNPYAMKEAQDLANLEAELFEELQSIKLVK